MDSRYFPRQGSPSGESVAASIAAPTNTLLLDPNLPPGATAALSAPLLGVTTQTILPSITSTVPSDTPTSSTTPSMSSPKLPTPTIVGIIVAIFIFLASLLVIFMTLKHKQKMRKRRRGKSWTKLEENKNAKSRDNVQMRSVVDKPAPPTNLLTSTSQSPNPFSPHLPSETVAASSLSHIPNPFTSPPHSPSPPHSRSTSYGTDHQSPSILLSALPTAQYAGHLSVTSTVPSDYESQQGSDYHYVLDSYGEQDRNSHTELIPPSQSQPKSHQYLQHNLQSQSPLTSKQASARELKAMQDIISALDSPQAKPLSTPSAWKGLTVEIASGKGSSRLSMGEGLVTPGGHSIKSEEGSVFNARQSVSTEVDVDRFPFPPSDLFRAVLGGSDDAGQGKVNVTNPFEG